MEGSRTGWWHRHGWTVAILLSAFGISLALRTIWAYPVIAQWGPLYTYGGGSDSYYHSRVMTYIIQNHQNLIHDPMLHFPFGAINPREPLFDWMNAILGIVFAPFFGGNAVVAGAWFLDLQAPLWAALGVFPVYLIGREVMSRRTGLIAAVIYPFLSANIDSSIFGYANYLPFYTFIILVTIYSYIRTVKAVGNRRWVESYRHPSQYVPGLRAFLRTERTAVKWAVFTGVSLGALALAWQGYTYAVAVIGVSVFIATVAERIRRVDSFGLYVATWITGLVGFPMAMPYYLVQQQFTTWFDLPLLLYFGVLLLLFPFLLMRDVPWVFSIPVLLGLVLAAAAGLAFFTPTYFNNIVTGQGYFVKNLIYSTVAEAQAPSIDQLVVGYGVVTFFLAFVGLALVGWELIHGRFKRYHVVFVVFAVLSIYLPISAAKFFLLGSPIFALLPAEALRRALDLGGYPELRRTVSSLSDRRSQFSAFRKAFKARHVLVMLLVVGLLLPNVWISIDAGIPGNTKSQLAEQVASTIPPWLQPNASQAAASYFGAAGSSLDTPNQYDSAGYTWLSQQDTSTPPSQRPAFVSWWDYGFQAIDQGQHPSVADNFQNGIDPAGQFLLSQNESQAIGVLTTTLLQAEAQATKMPYLPPALNQILAADGLNLAQLHTLLANTSADYSLVVAHPERYLPVNPGTLTHDNAMYLAMAYFLATSLPLSGVAKVYDDVQSYTGWSIRYAMVDSRLFPFSGTDTGIFYAPAELTGRIVNAAGEPTTFFNVTILGSDGNTYPAGQLPAGVSAVSYQVNYFAPFYNSFIYHVYIGYNGTDVGLGQGIPGVEGSSTLLSSAVMPGWMLQHFQVVYRTAYYCSQSHAGSATGANSGCFVAMNEPAAVARAAATNGTADTSNDAYFINGGEAMLEYYPGQTLLGDVSLTTGVPVSGARVTVFDGWGVPHMSTFTAADGSYSLVLPPGNDTVNITMGPLNALYQQGETVLKTFHVYVPDAVGLSYNAPNLVQSEQLAPASIRGFIYWNANNSSSYVSPPDTVVPGAQVVFWGPNGTSRIAATTDASGSFDLTNVPPGVYNYSVISGGHNYTEPEVSVTPGSVTNGTAALEPGRLSGTVRTVSGVVVEGSTVTLSNASGVVGQTVTNASGEYRLRVAGPGNFTITAVGPTPGDRSAGVGVNVPNPGSNVSTDLTVEPMSSVTLSLTANGAPATDIPVRFVPVASYSNASSPPLATLESTTSNGTVVVSSSQGTVTATLPAGSYSVYALGYVGHSLYANVSSVTVATGGATTGPSLALTLATQVSGMVAPVGTVSNATRVAVLAYAPSGAEVVSWAQPNGSFVVYLPSGAYSLVSYSGSNTATASSLSTGLAQVAVRPGMAPVEIAPTGTVASHFTVGSRLSSGALYPASSALVSVSTGTNGPTLPLVASISGNVTVFVPSSLPGGGTYCVSARALGFVGASECGVTPSGLAHLSSFPLAIANVSVSLTLVGLPAGSVATVNFTAESPTAVTRTFSGGPTFYFSSRPGLYGISARATSANGSVVYLPALVLPVTLPFGVTLSNVALLLFPQVVAKGTLSLARTVPLGNVTVSLTSPEMNLTVNGTTFTKGFYAAPGSYSVRANFSSNGVNYTNLTRLTVSSGGAITPTLGITVAGVTLSGTFQNATGATVPLNTTVTLVGPGGAAATATVKSGAFSLLVPPNVRYVVFANASALSPGPNGSFYRSWTVSPGASCEPTSSSVSCGIPLVPTTELVWLNGSLSSPGVPGLLPGTVQLVGPYPSDALTTVNVVDGTFAVRVLPGAYSVYAFGSGSGMGRAALASALALPSDSASLALSLLPTWAVTVSFAGPGGSSAGIGPVAFTVRDSSGDWFVYTGLSPSSSLTLLLPVGTYSLRASALGSTYGVPTNATASTTINVGTSNLATQLVLNYPVSYAVSSSLVGPSSATVNAGGTATFAFSVRATGTVPVTVHPVGTPAYWTFNFSFANASLTPGPHGSAVAGEVMVHVPAGTATSHPGVTLEFELANGTVVGAVSPAPTIQVVPYYGVTVGTSSKAPSQVGTVQVLQPFFVTDTGNTNETVRLSVANAPQLASRGWTNVILNQQKGPVTSVSLSAGQSQSFYVELNATVAVYLAPGTVTVSATVSNTNGAVSASDDIAIPLATVHPNVPAGGVPVVVTGPNIGTPPNSLPDWLVPVLVFVPAIGLAVAVFSYRWWRTRRWTRR